MRPMGLFDLADPLARLSPTDDPLEVLAKVMDVERFRAPPEAARGNAMTACPPLAAQTTSCLSVTLRM